MPSIAVTGYPTRTYNRVVTDYTGEPAMYAGLMRVDELTGAETPVRPHTAYRGSCMLVSCDGQQIWWDTEIPMDRPYHYRAYSCTPNQVSDAFARTVAGGWGTPDFGAAYTTSGGAGADYSVGAGVGKISLGSVNVARRVWTDLAQSDAEMVVDLAPTVVAATAAVQLGAMFRLTDASNFYTAEIVFGTAGTTSTRLRVQVAGVFTDLVTTGTMWAYTAATVMRMRVRWQGNRYQVRTWPTTRPEPPTWDIDTTNNQWLTQTAAGVRGILATGNTNGLPVVPTFDALMITGLDGAAVLTSTGATTAQAILGNDGVWWLKDPMRPCHDRRMTRCIRGTGQCAPGSGTMFAFADADVRATLTTVVQPQEQIYPLGFVRPRQAPSSKIIVITETLPDRDAMVALLAPGGPLLLQGPPQYGVEDRYLLAGDVPLSRALPDQRYPVRIVEMPYTTVGWPAGPMQGPCGERIADQCTVYPTWTAMAAAAVTYAQMIDGTTGGPGV